ncbi:unnamed protein product [Rotaria socialis]|uniref:Uncharacterized protein n=2 Tax=Rotaria socialis TaxID=392032 RepID=A0A818UHR1_9BILA|nr:unnamed protein product [Rotaria socialis]
MVDTLIRTMGNDNDDWEGVVDKGEFDKRLEHQDQDRKAKQFTSNFVHGVEVYPGIQIKMGLRRTGT